MLSTEQNIRFRDADIGECVDASGPLEATRSRNGTEAASFEDFLSRPIRIYEATWELGTSMNVSFDPWTRFLTDKRVSNRISNFSLMSLKLHVKFVVNGNSFYFGRAMASYLPCSPSDQTNGFANELGDLISLSQCPRIFLNPTTSSGGVLTLPFFYNYDYLDVTTAAAAYLGTIRMRDIAPLNHTAGGTDPLTITVFAWATDVQLAVPTSHNANGIVAQSGMESDKVNPGLISGPASAIAMAAGSLSKLPVIGPYATATGQVASAVGSVAKQFGFSRPATGTVPNHIQPSYAGNLANGTVPENVFKLSVDDKQETTIDPRVVGLEPGDTLSIANIVSRESWYAQFPIETSDAPDTLLWNTRVDPCQFAETSDGGLTLTATAMASLPFNRWTGTLNFRFQICCSSHHKGRIRFVYEPKRFSTTFVADGEFNVNKQEIVDIGETTDVTISVGNGNTLTYLPHNYPGIVSSSDMHSQSVLITTGAPGNGVLGVFVVNPLTTSTGSPSTVWVNVYISAGPDFKVIEPNDSFGLYTFKPQSGYEPQSGEECVLAGDDPAYGEHSEKDNIQSTEVSDNTALVFYGESIPTFRTLLKRFEHSMRIPISSGLGTAVNDVEISIRHTAFPIYRGNVPGAFGNGAVAPAKYNYTATTLIHWVTMAHAGWRGSMRFKYLMFKRHNGQTYPIYINNTGATSVGTPKYAKTISAYNPAAFGSLDEISRNSLKGVTNRVAASMHGAAVMHPDVNPSLTVEVPWYNSWRMIPGKRLDYTGSTDYISLQQVHLLGYSMGHPLFNLDILVSAGEDFQPLFFTGLPRIYLESAPPVPHS